MEEPTKLDEILFKTTHGLTLSLDLINKSLAPSHGEQVMSDKEVKLCILSLTYALEKQIQINEILIDRLDLTEKKKTRLRFRK